MSELIIVVEADQYNKTVTGSVFNEHRFKLYGTDIEIDWGDETQEIDTENTGEYGTTHVYDSAGIYTINITGNITGLADNFLRASIVKIKSITFPNTLQTIGSSCCIFDDDFTQTKIVIPENVTTIGNDCFRGTNITEIELPSTLTNLGNNFCKDCTSLEQATFKSCVPPTTTGGVFSGCSNYIIKVPRGCVNNYINYRHNNTARYPQGTTSYKVFGQNLSEKIYLLGETLAENLTEQGVTSSPDEGLTTLANKILNISTLNYQTLSHTINWNDNNNMPNTRPLQVPILLIANDEAIRGGMLPEDTTDEIASTYVYQAIVPTHDENNNAITYSTQLPITNIPNYHIATSHSGNNWVTNMTPYILFNDDCSTDNTNNYINQSIKNSTGVANFTYNSDEQAYVCTRSSSGYALIQFGNTTLHNNIKISADIKIGSSWTNNGVLGFTDVTNPRTSYNFGGFIQGEKYTRITEWNGNSELQTTSNTKWNDLSLTDYNHHELIYEDNIVTYTVTNPSNVSKSMTLTLGGDNYIGGKIGLWVECNANTLCYIKNIKIENIIKQGE